VKVNPPPQHGPDWVAAYYPTEIVEDDRTKTIACLLFDRIICHFPIAGTGCGGGAGVSDAFADDPLVEQGVIELREEFLLPDVDADFTPGHPWGTDEEFDRYVRLNVTAMALQSCRHEGVVPVTDSRKVVIPAFALEGLCTTRASRLQAGALARESLDLTLPAFSTLLTPAKPKNKAK
jgi:hypothetical protein